VKRSYCFYLLFSFCLLSFHTRAQNQTDAFSYLKRPDKDGKIEIIQDPAIRSRVNVHLSQQAKLNGIRGYRISVYFGSGQDSKKTAELTRAKFVSKYTDVSCYIKFEYPYFKVYVGDFRTRSGALKFLNEIAYDYPDAFIREDIINFPE